MKNKKNTTQIPLIYAYLYMKIKKQMKGSRISGSNLGKIIQKVILCDKDGGTKGIPRRHRYDIAKDLVDLGLIKKVEMIRRDYIYEDNNENVAEVAERLKDWNISEKLRKDEKVKEKLGVALDILDKDSTYRVVKSQCDKQINQAFW